MTKIQDRHSQAAAPQQQEPPLTRREAVFSGLSMAFGTAFAAVASNPASAQERPALSTFGTLDKPSFKVKPDLNLPTTRTYQQELAEQSPDLSEANTTSARAVFARVKGSISNLECLVESLNPSNLSPEQLQKQKFILERHISGFKATISNTLKFQAQSIQDARQSFASRRARAAEEFKKCLQEPAERRQGNQNSADKVARRIVAELTGEYLKADVHFSRRDLPGLRLGSSPRRGDIFFVLARDMSYPALLVCYAHEIGHHMSLHDEDAKGEAASKKPRSPDEVAAWEEASAFAFENVVRSYIEKKFPDYRETADLFCLKARLEYLDNFYSGKNTKEEHTRGMAYFDAALTHFKGDAAKAFNFLSSSRELLPEMLKIIENNKKAAAKLKETGDVPRLKSLQEEAKQLLDELESLSATLRSLKG